MPERQFELILNERGDRLWVRFVTQRGQVMQYVVRGEAMIEGRAMQIIRCDSAHGRGHCDILGWEGETIRKEWAAEGLDLGESFTEAMNNLEANWERYRTAFLRRRP